MKGLFESTRTAWLPRALRTRGRDGGNAATPLGWRPESGWDSRGRLFRVVSGLVLALFLALGAAQAQLAPVAVFMDPRYVDTTSGGVSAEAVNLSVTLRYLGHEVAGFTNVEDGLAVGGAVWIPELENGDWAAGLNAFETAGLRAHVVAGGVLAVHGGHSGVNRSVRLLNLLFGWSLAPDALLGGSLERWPGAQGTFFTNAAALLAAPNSTRGLLVESLPAGSRCFLGATNRAAAAWMPYGKGRVIYLGWDWYDAAPAGSQDGGWLAVLEAAVTELVAPLPPRVLGQPEGRVIDSGAPLTLSVETAGFTPVTHQWYHNGAPTIGDTNRLVLSRARPGDAGDYWVVASNRYGQATSAVAQVTVEAVAPRIEFAATNVTVAEGSRVELAARVFGTAPLASQWLSNGVPLFRATNATLLLDAVPLQHETAFVLAVTNEFGGATSAVALVTVLPRAPVILVEPPSVTVHDGELVTLAVSVAGTAPLACQWYAEGIPIPGATGTNFMLSPASVWDSGGYWVVVTNPAGSVTSRVAVVAVLPVLPSLTAPLAGQTVADGGTARFTVAATGTPPLAYQWVFEGAPIAGEMGTVLEIKPVTSANAGRYQVVVMNPWGSVTSKVAVLAIQASAPQIVSEPLDWLAYEGEAAEFRVEAIGTPPLRITWMLNGADIPGATGAVLRLDPVALRDAGIYQAKVSNLAGAVYTRAAVLTVRAAMLAPDLVWLSGGHAGELNGVVFSPDGRWLASAGDDWTIKLWNLPAGSLSRTLQGHQGDVRAVAFSPDSARVFSVAKDGTHVLWQVVNGAMVFQGGGNPEGRAAAFSPDGRRLLAGGGNDTGPGSVQLRNALTGALIEEYTGHTRAVRAVVFAPDSTRFASAGMDGVLAVRTLGAGGGLVASLDTGTEIHSLAWSPDGATILAGCDDRTARVYAAGDLRLVRVLAGHTDAVRSAVYSPDGGTAATGSWDNRIKLWNPGTGEELRSLRNEERVRSVAFSPSGLVLASGDKSGAVKLWDPAGVAPARSLTESLSAVAAAAFSPDGQVMACGYSNNTVKLWRVSDRALLFELSGGRAPIVFSPDGARVAAGAPDGGIRLWLRATGAPAGVLSGHTQPVLALRFTPDGQRLFSAGLDDSLRLWQVSDGAVLRVTGIRPQEIYHAAFSPDASLAAISTVLGNGPAVQVIRTADGTQLALTNHMFVGTVLAFSSDGARLAACDGMLNTRIWDMAGGRMLSSAALGMATELAADSMAFTPDGLYLALAPLGALSSPGGLSFLRAETGVVAAGYNQETGLIGFEPVPVAVSPDGRWFGWGRRDGTAAVARNPFGALRVTDWRPAATGWALSWEGGGGRYQVQQTTNLQAGAWIDLGPPTTAVQSTNALEGPAAFLRVKTL